MLPVYGYQQGWCYHQLFALFSVIESKVSYLCIYTLYCKQKGETQFLFIFIKY